MAQATYTLPDGSTHIDDADMLDALLEIAASQAPLPAPDVEMTGARAEITPLPKTPPPRGLRASQHRTDDKLNKLVKPIATVLKTILKRTATIETPPLRLKGALTG